ncbi:conserved protein, unknown function [Hepatocystis sp. ex Piliocolobus tephrosceles]|nr:conserved protein, unknown function [Hepatocystis sp. ex Piliocolobus tephrosceles]
MTTENGILFLGTGSSSSTPKLSHIFKNSRILSSQGIKIEKTSKDISKEDNELVDGFVEGLVSKGLETIDQLNDLFLKKKYPNYNELKCYTCFDALNNNSKNKRNNISVLLKSNGSSVLIDVGKTFRDSLLHNRDKIDFCEISIDSVLITHSHTDALNGIDDLRDLQEYKRVSHGDIFYYTSDKPIDVYVNEVSYERLKNGYDYLVKKRYENIFYSKIAALNVLVIKDKIYNKFTLEDEYFNQTQEKSNVVSTDEDNICKKNINSGNCTNNGNNINNIVNNTSSDNNNTNETKNQNDICNDEKKKIINIHTYDKRDEHGFIYTQFDKNKKIRFIPFLHGKNYVCLGYIVGNNDKLVYISDCSYIPVYVFNYIKKMGTVDVLIIDALYYKQKHYSHFSLYESIKMALIIKPKKVYFVGMSCDVEHNITNLYLQKLSKQYPNISFTLAHDGLFVPFNF